MSLTATFSVPSLNSPLEIQIASGSSVVFLGANGAGKTRLGAFIDRSLSATNVEVHRIAAHRSLTLNPNVVPPSLEVATKRLRFGHEDGDFQFKHNFRWQQHPETTLLNDFDHLLAALYAEDNDVSVSYRQSQISAPSIEQPPETKIDKLKTIWQTILPHRELVVLSGNIKTRMLGDTPQEYAASDMSDGERVIFYLLGQSLLAQPDTLLIFDEPELHINKSVLNRLWDAIESARPDCAFLYITHDVEFASSRHAAAKYAIRSYQKVPHEAWDIEIIPEDARLPDDVVATIVGSRRPVLFVEGTGGSLDSSLYRRVYSGFTVIPVGSCEQVIHTVASFAARPELHRVGCGGLVDADGRTEEEAGQLVKKGVYRLPVSEVENLLLLPKVFLALAKDLKFDALDAQSRLTTLQNFVFSHLESQIEEVCLRYTKRRIDAEMKEVGLSGTDVAGLDAEFRAATSRIDAFAIFDQVMSELSAALVSRDYERVLLYYDNKGLLAEAAKQLGYKQKALEEFVGESVEVGWELGVAGSFNGLPADCDPSPLAARAF